MLIGFSLFSLGRRSIWLSFIYCRRLVWFPQLRNQGKLRRTLRPKCPGWRSSKTASNTRRPFPRLVDPSSASIRRHSFPRCCPASTRQWPIQLQEGHKWRPWLPFHLALGYSIPLSVLQNSPTCLDIWLFDLLIELIKSTRISFYESQK